LTGNAEAEMLADLHSLSLSLLAGRSAVAALGYDPTG
jgi:hypothetical protein